MCHLPGPTDEAADGRFLASEVVGRAFRLVRAFAARRCVALSTTLDRDSLLAGDRRLAIQTVVNLANNAVRACANLGGMLEILGYRAGEDVCRIERLGGTIRLQTSLRGTTFTIDLPVVPS